LTETVAPVYHADRAYQPFSLKPFLKRRVIKLFMKKFVIKRFFKHFF
jgi:hypothetical protein